jgi:glycosyltransferase involved in cell wall biosynthesis
MYFDPQLEFSNPFEREINVITFTGAMDYWANIDAVKWFVEQVLQEIRKECPLTRFYIVGANPSDEVIGLQKHEGIVVTGRVDDIRPYVKHSSLIVAPMRIARGIQNKVLEAMAMAKPLVATSLALEGIVLCDNYKPRLADSPEAFAEQCLAALQENSIDNVTEARDCIKQHYDWEQNLHRVVELLQGDGQGCGR